jgi:putative ATP-dependent endonuclease of OLD family
MRIESVEIKNLRCVKDANAFLDKYTCFVGPNGAGKSTVLLALNIFFRQAQDSPTEVTFLTSEDFHMQDTSVPIEITVTFTEIGESAAAEFKDYVRQGKLVVSAVANFDATTNRAEVRQYGQRMGLPAFKPFFRAHGDNASAETLKTQFAALGVCRG